MKNFFLVLFAVAFCGCTSVNKTSLGPQVNQTQVFLSISEDETNIILEASNLNQSHSYNLLATKSLTNPDWLTVTPINNSIDYVLVMPKSVLFTNTQQLFFRTQDLSL